MNDDDLNSESENIHDCYNFYNKAKARLDQASFNLRKFQSNSCDLEYLINGEINHNSIVTKVLGLICEKQKENITFSLQNLVALIYPCPTKRQLLSFIASVYDPLGLFNPFVFCLKVLFQMLCREKLGWSDILSEVCLEEWRLIWNDVRQAQDIEISRWYDDFNGVVEVELYGFSDAKVLGYRCCIYIRYCYNNYSYTTSLVFLQSRIASIKTQTIRRLKL